MIKNVERNAEANGQFEKENIVNAHIIEHLVDYIKKMSQSFTDLYDGFYDEEDYFFFSPKDALITELRTIFSNEIIANYFLMIFTKIEQVLKDLSDSTSTNEILLIQKFYFLYYILYKMNDTFIYFLNSNVSYLVDTNLTRTLTEKMSNYMSSFYNIFLSRNSFQMLLINKEDFKYYNEYVQGVIKTIKIFFIKEHYNSNRAYEKPVLKFVLFLYLLSTLLLLVMKSPIEFEKYDELLNELTDLTLIFIRLNTIDFVLHLHENAKIIGNISDEKGLPDPTQDQKGKIKSFLIKFKKITLNANLLIKFLNENKINEKNFIYFSTLIFMKILGINCDDLKFVEQEKSNEKLQLERVQEEEVDLVEKFIDSYTM